MTKLQKAKILDEILALFKGNVTRNYTELNEQFGDRYHEIENQIKFLIGDGAVTEHQGKLTMSAKGFAIYTDLENLGYVTKELERLAQIKKDNQRFWWIFWITLITLLVTIYPSIFRINTPPTKTPNRKTINPVAANFKSGFDQFKKVGLAPRWVALATRSFLEVLSPHSPYDSHIVREKEIYWYYEIASMIDLDNKIWQGLEGGYKIPYDASIPLRQLEQTNDPKKINEIFLELWNELHHQGDVGLASYLAVPQLIRIGINKKLFDWNILGLCAVIEIQRHAAGNPPLPPEFEEYYNEGLEKLRQFVLSNINDKDKIDDTTYCSGLSVLAITAGRIKLGKAIMNLDDDSVLDEFLEQF